MKMEAVWYTLLWNLSCNTQLPVAHWLSSRSEWSRSRDYHEISALWPQLGWLILGNYLINGSFTLRSIEKSANLYQTTRRHPCVRQTSQWTLWEPRLVPRFVVTQHTNPIKPDCQAVLVLTENIITDSKSLSSNQKVVGIFHLTHSCYILRSFWHSHSFTKVKIFSWPLGSPRPSILHPTGK